MPTSGSSSAGPRRRRRIALFTHDAYGLGHVRRSVHLLSAMARRDPEATLLLITGSPATHLLRSLPPRVDYVKIPTIVTSGSEETKPPTLDIGLAELASLRGEITRRTLEAFAPDVFVVDNFPLGTRLELLPALRSLRERGTRTVLGLRDVVDPPEKVRKDWGRDGLYEVVDRYYDRVVVYGMREVLDAAEAYDFAPSIARKLHYCGYVTSGEPPSRSRDDVLRELGFPDGFLLATVGGGGDGLPVLSTFLEALGAFPGRSALLAAGEFMSPSDRAALDRLATARPGVLVRDHVVDLPSYLAAADAVVAMGGYNTCAEILSVKARAVLVPRTWKSGEHGHRARARVDAEQLVRAEGLSRLGVVELLGPGELSGQAMAEALARALDRRRSRADSELRLDGAPAVAEHVLALAGEVS